MSKPSSEGNVVQACTAPTPWLGFLIALLLVVAAALAFILFKP